eukprot:CAMPEP_0175134314 /NCGR_PEP_ID=MMETSP0087-20121206/8114_1 /TAXON_ID=136419 /ORGANISM="Unknown Unknown, Strain D1" /LENGTH=427 /DNA_ID=CAMNT_0016416871 /DNA_START=37 /DNA_END=1317 /DNA_ORIENTATION=-
MEMSTIKNPILDGIEKTKTIDGSSLPKFWVAGTPRKVYPVATVQRMSPLNIIDGTLEVKFWIDVYWQPDEEEVKAGDTKLDILDQFQQVNAVEVKQQEVVRALSLKDVDVGGGETRSMWHCIIQIVASYKQNLLLHTFPFDCHNALVRFEGSNVKQVQFAPMPGKEVLLSLETSLCPMLGWSWKGVGVLFTGTAVALSKSGNSYTQMVVSFRLARDFGSYLSRIVSFICVLTLSSFLAVSIPVSDVGDRLGFIFTILLTLVAFQGNVATMLPETSYLTLLEMYNVFCFLLVMLVGVWCGFAGVLRQNDEVDPQTLVEQDYTVFKVGVCVAIGAHALLSVGCAIVRIGQLKKLENSRASKPAENLQVRTTQTEIVQEEFPLPAGAVTYSLAAGSLQENFVGAGLVALAAFVGCLAAGVAVIYFAFSYL